MEQNNIISKIVEMNNCNGQSGFYYLNQQFENAIFYSQKCCNIAKEIGNKEFEIISYIMMAQSYDAIGRFEDAIRYSRMCLEVAMQNPELTIIEDTQTTAYMVLGSSHKLLKKYDEAFVYATVSHELAREYSDKHAEMNACMLLGAVYERLKEYEDAIHYLKKSIQLAKQLQNRYVEMQTHLILGLTFWNLQKYENVIIHSKECVAIARNNAGYKKFEKRALILLILAYASLKKYNEEISHALACIKLVKETREDTFNLELILCSMLAHANYMVDRFDDAVDFGNRCLRMAQEACCKCKEIKAYLLLGKVYLSLSKRKDCMMCINKALDFARETGDKPVQVDALITLGLAYFWLDRCDLAIPCFNESQAIAQEIDGFDRLVRMNSTLIKMMHHYQNFLNTGHSYLEEQLKNSEEIQSEDGLVNELWFPVELCLSFVEDEDAYHMSIGRQMIKSELGELDYEDPETPEMVCQWFINRTQAKYYRQFLHSLQTFIQKFPSESFFEFFASRLMPKTRYDKALESFQTLLPLARKNYWKRLEAQCLFQIGSIHQTLGNTKEAEKSYREAIGVFETLFDRLCKDADVLRISFFNAYEEFYKTLSDLLIKSNRVEEGFLMLENSRARVLRDNLAVDYKMKRTGKEKEQMDLSVVKSLVSKSNYSILFYSVVLKKLHTFVVDAEGLHFFSQPVKDCEIVDKALMELKVRQPGKCEGRSLDDTEYLDGQDRRVGCVEDELQPKPERNIFEESWRDENESNLNNVLRDLYQKLLKQVMRHRIGNEIIVITDGPIAKVPFAALLDPKTGQYLSQTKKIRFAPSIRILKILRECPAHLNYKTGALIIGDPLVGRVMLNGKENYISPLIHARHEAETIANILGVEALVEEKATKAFVIEKLKEGASIVHIAAHGSLSQAAIVLAPSPEVRATKIPDEEDYMLTMADVQKAQVRAQLVVLSCCHSGRGKIRAEGVVGMCRAFLASGARAVVASLWAIEDSATLTFMTLFYKHLKERKSASESLQLTMSDMRDSEVYSKPRYWAPFVLIGDDVSIDI